MKDDFTVVGMRPAEPPLPPRARRERVPLLSVLFLGLLLAGCLIYPLMVPGDPGYMDLSHVSVAPCRDYPFGTDTMGRDIFAMIFYGGRLSLFIGLTSAAVSAVVAVVLGAAGGWVPERLGRLLERGVEILLSVPNLLLVVLLQGILGQASALSISLVLGLTGWMSIAKVVRAEVRQLRSSEFVVAARAMGGGFFYILRKHLVPNFWPSILFMVVMNIRSAMAAEATLSFLGMGLPLETVSWGSMLSLSEKALLTGAWWIILIPGAFLVLTLLCITRLGDWLRTAADSRRSNL